MARTSNSDGYVTLAVLLVVGLLAAIVSSILAVSRPALGLARLGGDEAAAGALLDGGLTTAGFLLFGAKQDPAKVDKLALHLHTGDVQLAVVDEGARVDLNTADERLLAGLYTSVGGKSLSPEAFAGRVMDWRDTDSDLNLSGAEVSSYNDAGLGYGPSNLPFHSVDEMRRILGLSGPDFTKLEPYLTVFTGTPKVDPLFASETVLRGIPGVTRGQLQQVLQARKAGQDRARIAEGLPEASDFLLDKSSGVYRVKVEVTLKDGYSDAAEAVIIAPQADGSAEYRTVAWSKRTTPVPSP